LVIVAFPQGFVNHWFIPHLRKTVNTGLCDEHGNVRTHSTRPCRFSSSPDNAVTAMISAF
jgi:hypothetical protein